ncbi:MAG: FHA domain-containing protein [Sandaracinaceae bacterium]
MSRFVLQLGETEVLLHEGQHRIGRDPGCEIRLIDESVSRRHATLRVSDHGVELIDHGSRNGVRVNGERVVGSAPVRPGDKVRVGTYELMLAEQGHADSVEAATKPLPRLPKPGTDSLTLLSPRERDVFERLARGQTQREAAEALGLSVKTVETYRARIADKLGLKSRADLVAFALDTGVLR